MKEMKHDSSTIAWNAMGDEWVELAQTGESRMCFIMPNMLKFIGNVKGKKILDLGCGEGGYSRELVKRGAQLVSMLIMFVMWKCLKRKCVVKHTISLNHIIYGAAYTNWQKHKVTIS